jgi:alkanesulfonate monooxygenase SsuD/methylene tetrahydromethanopterin reductase-like flavin-dependent oxidoreductase (luciferase family)
MEWTGQLYADSPAVAVQTYVEAPPERVWALVSDIYLMPRLSAELREVEWLDGVDGPALSPKMLELTGELADGWLGTSFVPEGAGAYFGPLDAGLARAGRTRADLDICQGAEVDFIDAAGLAQAVARRKKELAFSLGGMGSATTNFYNDAYSRQGWAESAAEVRERWQAGDRDGAAGLITDEMVLTTTLIGTEDMVRARLRTWRDTGVDTVRLYPAGDTLAARLDNLARAIELVHSLD